VKVRVVAVELLDYSYDRLTPAQIRTAGRVGVIRYVASGRPLVSATRAEVDSYRNAGLAFVAVWQNGKDRALAGRAAGLADARDAAAYTAGLGATGTDPVYFAVDFDAQPPQLAAVTDYVRALASVLGWARVGVYGGAPVLEHLRAVTPLGLFWQTIAWSSSRLLPYANLHQYAVNQTVAGKAVDYDRALTADYGQWDRMALKSSPRGTAPVIWVVLHTAEGATSVDNLRNFFADPNTQASCHAGADDTQLSDGWVPYDRAAWTLRNGNPISDNLEMCGFASWTRAQWLEHAGMIRNAARWAAGRCQARGIPARRLTVAQVAARNTAGILDHNTYTQATGDGTHWDIGPGFPWDVFLADVARFMNGEPEDTSMSAADVTDLKTFFTTAPQVKAMIRGEVIAALSDPTHAYLQDELDPLKKAAAAATQQVTQVAQQVTAQGAALTAAAAKVAAASDAVTRLDASLAGLTGQVATLSEQAAAAVAKLGQLAEAAGAAQPGVSGQVEVQGVVQVRPVPSTP
jgi:Rv2525c-like, glycoside hydrolase-like domain